VKSGQEVNRHQQHGQHTPIPEALCSEELCIKAYWNDDSAWRTE